MKKLVVAPLALALVSASASAQESVSKAEKQTRPSELLAQQKLAAQLVLFGSKSGNAMPFLTALSMMSDAPTSPIRGEKVDNLSPKASKKSATSMDPKVIAEMAKPLCDGQRSMCEILTILQSQASEQQRGAVGGPCMATDVVPALASHTWNIRFAGGELAEVIVVGDGDIDLELMVFDDAGNAVTSDKGGADGCYVNWTPEKAGNYTIKIANIGSQDGQYVIITN